MKVLLVNDDGIGASGLLALHRALFEAGHEVWAVAPAVEKSGISQAITARPVLKVSPVAMASGDRPGFAVDGTPADCVCLGIASLAPRVDFVLSGINNGPNLGHHVNYSGTVGAAAEAAALGRPALAVSLDWSVAPLAVGPQAFLRAARRTQEDFRDAARKTVEIMEAWPEFDLPEGLVLNVNFPAGPAAGWRGLKWAGLAANNGLDRFSFKADYETCGHNGRLYRREPAPQSEPPAKGSDEYWIAKGYATLTPLRPRTACAAVLDALGVD